MAGQAHINMIFNTAQYLPDLEVTSALGLYTNAFLFSDYCIISDIFMKNVVFLDILKINRIFKNKFSNSDIFSDGRMLDGKILESAALQFCK